MLEEGSQEGREVLQEGGSHVTNLRRRNKTIRGKRRREGGWEHCGGMVTKATGQGMQSVSRARTTGEHRVNGLSHRASYLVVTHCKFYSHKVFTKSVLSVRWKDKLRMERWARGEAGELKGLYNGKNRGEIALETLQGLLEKVPRAVWMWKMREREDSNIWLWNLGRVVKGDSPETELRDVRNEFGGLETGWRLKPGGWDGVRVWWGERKSSGKEERVREVWALAIDSRKSSLCVLRWMGKLVYLVLVEL